MPVSTSEDLVTLDPDEVEEHPSHLVTLDPSEVEEAQPEKMLTLDPSEVEDAGPAPSPKLATLHPSEVEEPAGAAGPLPGIPAPAPVDMKIPSLGRTVTGEDITAPPTQAYNYGQTAIPRVEKGVGEVRQGQKVKGAADILGGVNEGLSAGPLPLGSAPAAVIKGVAGSVAASAAAPYIVKKAGGSQDAQDLAREAGAALPLVGGLVTDLRHPSPEILPPERPAAPRQAPANEQEIVESNTPVPAAEPPEPAALPAPSATPQLGAGDGTTFVQPKPSPPLAEAYARDRIQPTEATTQPSPEPPRGYQAGPDGTITPIPRQLPEKVAGYSFDSSAERPAGRVVGYDADTHLPIIQRVTPQPEGESTPAHAPVITPAAREAGADVAEHPELKGNVEEASNQLQSPGSKEPESGRPVTQPSDNPAVNQALATAAMPDYRKALTAITKSIPGAELAASRDVKNPDRLAEKVNEEGQPPQTVNDYGAAQISVDSPQARDAVVAAVKQQFPIVKEQDQFEHGDKEFGYRSHTLQVQTPNGSSQELQIVPKEVLEAGSHGDYVKARDGDEGARAAAKATNDTAMDAFNQRNRQEKAVAGLKLSKGARVTLPDGSTGTVSYADKNLNIARVTRDGGGSTTLATSKLKPVEKPQGEVTNDRNGSGNTAVTERRNEPQATETAAVNEREGSTTGAAEGAAGKVEAGGEHDVQRVPEARQDAAGTARNVPAGNSGRIGTRELGEGRPGEPAPRETGHADGEADRHSTAEEGSTEQKGYALANISEARNRTVEENARRVSHEVIPARGNHGPALRISDDAMALLEALPRVTNGPTNAVILSSQRADRLERMLRFLGVRAGNERLLDLAKGIAANRSRSGGIVLARAGIPAERADSIMREEHWHDWQLFRPQAHQAGVELARKENGPLWDKASQALIQAGNVPENVPYEIPAKIAAGNGDETGLTVAEQRKILDSYLDGARSNGGSNILKGLPEIDAVLENRGEGDEGPQSSEVESGESDSGGGEIVPAAGGRDDHETGSGRGTGGRERVSPGERGDDAGNDLALNNRNPVGDYLRRESDLIRQSRDIHEGLENLDPQYDADGFTGERAPAIPPRHSGRSRTGLPLPRKPQRTDHACSASDTGQARSHPGPVERNLSQAISRSQADRKLRPPHCPAEGRTARSHPRNGITFHREKEPAQKECVCRQEAFPDGD